MVGELVRRAEMSYLTEFKTMASLTLEEKDALWTLTLKRDEKRSLFQQWLTIPTQGMYAALLRNSQKIVAWAAVSTLAGWKEGVIGVCVDYNYRGKGLAHQALDTLLEHLSTIDNPHHRPEYLRYNDGMEKLFRPAIEKYGFKDYWKKLEEERKNTLEENR